MPLLLNGSSDTVHGILGAMRFVTTAGATRPFEGPEAALVQSMAQVFGEVRPDLELEELLSPHDGHHTDADKALALLCSDLIEPRERHEAMVAATLCALVTDDFDEGAAHAVKRLAEALEIDDELAVKIDQLSGNAAQRVGADLLRHFMAEKSGVAEEILQARLDAGGPPLLTDPRVFAEYSDLLHAAPPGSTGEEVLRFYAHTGFSIPGSVGAPPLEVLGAHDVTHVLAGYATSAEDEIYVALFSAANSTESGIDYLAAIMVQWHHEVKIGVFAPSRSALSPVILAEATRRGAATATDLSSASFDWQGLLHLPLEDARAAIGIEGVGTVTANGPWDAFGRGGS